MSRVKKRRFLQIALAFYIKKFRRPLSSDKNEVSRKKGPALASPLVFPETECLLWDFWESAANLLIFHTLPSLQTLVLSHFMFRISLLLLGCCVGSILSLFVIVVWSRCIVIVLNIAICPIYNQLIDTFDSQLTYCVKMYLIRFQKYINKSTDFKRNSSYSKEPKTLEQNYKISNCWNRFVIWSTFEKNVL